MKKILILVLFILSTHVGVVGAMDMSDVEVGSSVYLKKILTGDEKCQVVEVSSSDNTVLVKKDDGSTE